MSSAKSQPSVELPKQRGLRLKKLRNMANLSRTELCEQHNININTLKGWEIGRHGGLTTNAAQMLCEVFATHGVICNVEWLLEKMGAAPQLIAEFQQTPTANKSKEASQIDNELQFLRQSYQGLVDCKISDESMLPFYNKGDYVAGVANISKWKKLIGYRVIATLEDDSVVVAELLQCVKHNTLCLFASNGKKKTIHQPAIKSLAKIFWHRSPTKT